MSTSKHERGQSDAVDQKAAKKSKKFSFPGRHQNRAGQIYRRDRGYRDNSAFLERIFYNVENQNALLFTRPMQLGKTTLLSLAEELFSVNRSSSVVDDLEYSPGEEDRNTWFVVRVDFGTVSAGRLSNDDTWESIGERMDKAASQIIKQMIMYLLLRNRELHDAFLKISGFDEDSFHSQAVASIVNSLYSSVNYVGGKLLFLIDEYDLPIRDCLLRYIPSHGRRLYADVKDNIKAAFGEYFAFFRAVKTSLENLDHAKILLTGITPIGVKEMSGLTVTSLTFEEDMADAVGLTEKNVRDMLASVHDIEPFASQEEVDRAFELIRYHFNNLHFPGGSPLYHTALVNGTMNMLLQKPAARCAFLANGTLPEHLLREVVPSPVYDVLRSARNLRHVVNMLAEGLEVTGYNFNEDLSLEHLLQQDIKIGDYLTLLVHLGVAAARGEKEAPRFTLTSVCYQKSLLEPLLDTLQASLVALTSLRTTDELYGQGEGILADFVTSISRSSMASLMAWASSDEYNHIYELQFQSHFVSEAHAILRGEAQTTQEDTLPMTGKRTDVTLSSGTCVVILELKQVKEEDPDAQFLSDAHVQLSGYVDTRRKMEKAGAEKGRPVAGFVVVMCSNGANYVVEKLRSDHS